MAFEDHQRWEGQIWQSDDFTDRDPDWKNPSRQTCLARSRKGTPRRLLPPRKWTKLAEARGEEMWDRQQAKRHVKKNAGRMYDEHYIDGQNAHQYDPNPYGAPDRISLQYGTNW